MRGRDGEKFAGERLRVEVARGGRRDGGRGPSGAGGSRGPPKHSDYRVIVTGLPSGTSWQVCGRDVSSVFLLLPVSVPSSFFLLVFITHFGE